VPELLVLDEHADRPQGVGGVRTSGWRPRDSCLMTTRPPAGQSSSIIVCGASRADRRADPIAASFSSTRPSARSPVGDEGGAERVSGTSGTAQDEQRDRPTSDQSRGEPRANGEREGRCRHALVVVGERLVPEALQGAEIVAVGQPLELAPTLRGDQADRVGVGVNELAEEIPQAGVAGNRRRLRREKPQRHAARIIGPMPPDRKDPEPNDPGVCEDSIRQPNRCPPGFARTNHKGVLQRTRFS
jgi:hypothetical protein